MNKEEIEKIFRNSNSHDMLFDAFQYSITNKIDDISLYKVLLANPTLSNNEITMFGDKITKEFPNESYDLYIWLAELFSAKPFNLDCMENALHYYKLAYNLKPHNHSPLIDSFNLYNYDLELALNRKIIEFIKDSLPAVNIKSKVYSCLADHYVKIGDRDKSNKYKYLAAQAAKKER